VSAHIDHLSLAARGDDEALAVLVRTYHDRVYRYGRRVCHDKFDADDAVQDAFIKLARRPEVASDPGVFAWLARVVRNTCMRMLRPFLRERRTLGERIEETDQVPSEGLDPELALQRWRLVDAVHRAIATLSRPHREVLVLRDLEGLSGPETCAALGLTEPTMKTRLNRARTELRGELERSGTTARSGVR
jgi:RNA polymerase sigma-70 factor, ECF subfamily